MRGAFGVVGLLAVLCAGCESKLSGSISLDGKAFSPASCRSGQVSGFTGVDLVGADGTKLRLVSLPNGKSSAFLFPAGAATAIELGSCGAFAVERQNSQINKIYNVKGSATLSCSVDGHSAAGSASFENCH
jgi:hypothetical protein